MSKRLVWFLVGGVIEIDDDPVVEVRPAQRPMAGLVRRVSTIPMARVPNAAAIEARAVELVDAHERSALDTVRPPKKARAA